VEMDEETLREIANLTGGQFFRATDNESLEHIYAEINELERTEIEVTEYQNIHELYPWFTIPATILALLYLLLARGIYGKFV